MVEHDRTQCPVAEVQKFQAIAILDRKARARSFKLSANDIQKIPLKNSNFIEGQTGTSKPMSNDP